MLNNPFISKIFSFYKEKIQLRILNVIERQNITSLAVIAGVLVVSLIGVIILNSKTPSRSIPLHSEKNPTAAIVHNSSPYNNLKLEARSAIVWDIRNHKALYESNADAVRPLASLTKIMTAITALDLVSKNTIVRISPDFIASDGDSGLFAEESWKLKDLLDLSLVMSSNDGASAIAAAAGNSILGTEQSSSSEEAFVNKMNEKASSIGLAEMHFINPTGLDEGSETGGMGSARDFAKLFEYALENYPDAIEATRYQSINVTSLDHIKHTAVNTNLDINKIPDVIASKTGYTDFSGGNLAVIFDAGLNRPVAIVALGSTYEGRFGDVYKLVKATRNYLAQSDAAEALRLANNK